MKNLFIISSSSPSGFKRGFTLVELLVVIAIVAFSRIITTSFGEGKAEGTSNGLFK